MIRESFRLQRALVGLGYRITRYSALAFKVDVDEGDGVVRGLDVFGGFLMDGHLHLMGEIREPFEESWIFPLGTTTLEGRTFPAPADPDKLLTATYGPVAHARPGVQVRAARDERCAGSTAGSAACASAGPVGPDLLPRAQGRSPSRRRSCSGWQRREPDAATYVDLGCGRGADVLCMAERGVPVVRAGLPGPLVRRRAAAFGRRRPAAGLVTFWQFNLLELRDVLLGVGAIVARQPARRGCSWLATSWTRSSRRRGASCGVLARMTLAADGDGEVAGRLYLEFLVRKGDDGYAGQQRVRAAGLP